MEIETAEQHEPL